MSKIKKCQFPPILNKIVPILPLILNFSYCFFPSVLALPPNFSIHWSNSWRLQHSPISQHWQRGYIQWLLHPCTSQRLHLQGLCCLHPGSHSSFSPSSTALLPAGKASKHFLYRPSTAATVLSGPARRGCPDSRMERMLQQRENKPAQSDILGDSSQGLVADDRNWASLNEGVSS